MGVRLPAWVQATRLALPVLVGLVGRRVGPWSGPRTAVAGLCPGGGAGRLQKQKEEEEEEEKM